MYRYLNVWECIEKNKTLQQIVVWIIANEINPGALILKDTKHAQQEPMWAMAGAVCGNQDARYVLT